MASTTSTTFTPYWRQVNETAYPYSFVFFVVAQITGCRRPVAVVSSRACADLDGSLQGAPLLAACQRIITIFSDKTNHPAIKAELALAVGYYVRNGGLEEYRPEPVELPENQRNYLFPRLESGVWDQISLREFPLITACLLQGVAFDSREGYCYPASPEPLGTVYRDISVEWGMVVIDITELCKVRYGIVGFATAPMKWASSAAAIQEQRNNVAHPGFTLEYGGEFRVLDEVRPHVVMSGAEYLMKRCERSRRFSQDKINELLAPIPLVDSNALELIWPQGSDDDVALSIVGLSVGNKSALYEQAIRSLIQSTINVDTFNMAIFDDVREVPNFQETLRRNLLQYSTQLGSTSSAGQLLRLAFDDGEHLSLEQLDNISVEAILAALKMPDMGKISSISLCIDSIQNLSIELIEGLSQSESLRKIYFMESPFRENNTSSGQFFETLCTRPQFLSSVKVMFADSYSAALRKKFWITTIPKKTTTSVNAVQIAPLSIFPIQQILIPKVCSSGGRVIFKTISVYLGDSLLNPERFAVGFLIYLRTFIISFDDNTNPAAHLFSFSTAPESLSSLFLHSAEISPILTESFALSSTNLPDDLSPRIRDLVPNGWTILVLPGRHKNRETNRVLDTKDIRYAFIRARKQTINAEDPPLIPLGPDELEVIGLKEFLAIEAPEVDSELVDRRLEEVAEHIARLGDLPENIKPLSVLDHNEAGEILLECLKDVGENNRTLREVMRDDREGTNEQWYPELL